MRLKPRQPSPRHRLLLLLRAPRAFDAPPQDFSCSPASAGVPIQNPRISATFPLLASGALAKRSRNNLSTHPHLE